MITIVGLGVEKGDVTARGLEAARRADKVVLRTGLARSADSLREAGIAFETLDGLYEKSRNFETLKKNLAAEVVRRAAGCDLCYCVDGGVNEDGSAALLCKRKDVKTIEGVTKGASAARKAGLFGAVTAVSAYELSESKPTLPLVVYDVDGKELAGDVKLFLTEKFGDEAPACLICGGEAKPIALYEADRAERYDYASAIVVYDAPLLEKKRYDLEDFLAVLRRLRAPDGCPWDRAQTHESIRINLIEEAYELADAIDCKDPDKMREEAGDVLMQAAFHALIEEERGNFTMTDVLTEVTEKLITRHTHVFGSDKASSADGALSVWDRNKMKEKRQETFSDAVNDVPQCFPALLRAQKIAKRMEKGGWKTETPEELRSALEEAYDALAAATERGDGAEISARLGDYLMCAVRLGRAAGADCEQALLDTVKKMQKRYSVFEALALADGKDVTALTEEERRAYEERSERDVEES
ncbi:MAG: nucleoside triphosphate pyrophosphohydrolase [Candidatus Gallimonas sp.]